MYLTHSLDLPQLPSLGSNIAQLLGQDSLVLSAIAIVTLNSGGLGNLVQYIINEGWTEGVRQNRPRDNESSMITRMFISISTRSSAKTDESIRDNEMEQQTAASC